MPVAALKASLKQNVEGGLITDLSSSGDAQAPLVEKVIQQINADVILINQFDYDADGTAADLLGDNYMSRHRTGISPTPILTSVSRRLIPA